MIPEIDVAESSDWLPDEGVVKVSNVIGGFKLVCIYVQAF